MEPLEAVVPAPRSSQGVAFRLEPLTFALHRSSRFDPGPGRCVWGPALTFGAQHCGAGQSEGAAPGSSQATPAPHPLRRVEASRWGQEAPPTDPLRPVVLAGDICAHMSVARGLGACSPGAGVTSADRAVVWGRLRGKAPNAVTAIGAGSSATARSVSPTRTRAIGAACPQRIGATQCQQREGCTLPSTTSPHAWAQAGGIAAPLS